MLTGHTFPTLAQVLVEMTPNPHPSGDMPADMSQLVPLTTYTEGVTPPDLTTIPEVHQFVLGVEQIHSDIENNPDARPAFWVQNTAGTNSARVYLDDNGMLITQWTIDWGDGTTPDVVTPSPWVFHQYAAAGDYTVSVTAVSMDGSYTSAGVDPPISPSAPAVRVAGQQMVTAGETFSLANLAAFSLPTAPSGSFTYAIDWGDGTAEETSPSVTTIAAGSADSPFMAAISADHIYSDSGSFFVAVTVTSSTGLSDTQSIPVDVLMAPATPAGFTTTLVSDSQVGLAWTADTTDLASFQIEQSNDGGGTWSLPVTVAVDQGDVTMPGPFDPTANYVFQIQAVNSAGAVSSPAVVDVVASPSATASSDTEVNLSWHTLPSNVTSRTLERSDDYGATWNDVGISGATTTGNVVTFTDTSLVGGSSYQYQLVATLGDGTTAASPITTVATLPSAPSSLTATYVSGSEVEVDWESNSPTASGYQIEGKLNSGSFTVVGTADSGATSFIAVGPFTSGDTWQFKVEALDANANPGPLSSAASVTIPGSLPAQPTSVTATVDSSYQVTLSWGSVSGASGYIVERQASGDTDWQTIDTPTSTSSIDATVQPESEYSYRVIAVNSNGGSTPSSSVAVQTDLLPPTNVRVTVLSGDSIEVDWSVNSTAGGGFEVVESTTGTGSPSTWTSVATPTADQTSTVIHAAFVNSDSYYFAVRKSALSGGSPSDFTTAAAVVVPSLPAEPTFGTPTINSPSEIEVRWTDNGQSSFVLQRSSDNGSTWTTIATLSAGTTSYTDTSVTSGDSYIYRISGTSAPVVTETVRSEIDLSWSDPNSGAVPYTLERSADGDATWTTIASLAGGTTSYDDTDVTTGISYDYKLIGTNTAGDSGSATTTADDSSASILPPTDVQVTWDQWTPYFTVTWTNQNPNIDLTEVDWTEPGDTTDWLHGMYVNGGAGQARIDASAFPTTTAPPLPGLWKVQVSSIVGDDQSDESSQSFTMPYLAPVARDINTVSTEATELIDVLAYDVTSDSQSLTCSIDNYTQPSHGSVSKVLNGGKYYLQYTVTSGYLGLDSFTYTVTNGHLSSAPATVRLKDAIGTSGDDEIRQISTITAPGIVVSLDTSVNADGAPGFADGYGIYGNSDYADEEDQLIPLWIPLPDGFDSTAGLVSISYSGSDPMSVTRAGSGSAVDPYQYALPADGGALRIWTYPGARTGESIVDFASGYGDYVPSGTYNSNSIFHDFLAGDYLGLYVERVRGSQTAAENEITVTFDLDGSGDWTTPETIYVADPPQLDSDALNASSNLPNRDSDGNASVALEQYSQQLLAAPSQPGKIIVVNDSLMDGVPAFANFTADSSNPQFVPLVVKLPQETDLSTALLEFDYDGSDPSIISIAGSAPDQSYLPAPGVLRLWTVNGTSDRSVNGVTDSTPGDYIAPNTPFLASVLGATWTDVPDSQYEEAYVYVEAVRPSTSTGEQEVTLKVDFDGPDNFVSGGLARFTAVQDTVPDYSAAGLAGVAHGADGGNPMSNAYSGAVRLADGVVNYATTDFSVPGPGFARTVSRVWTDQPGLVVNPSFGNGQIMTQLPYLIQATSTIIAVIDGQPFYFDQLSSGDYQERFFGQEQLTYDSTGKKYTFTDTTGTRIVFNDFTIQNYNDASVGMYKRGSMISVTDAYSNAITATAWDTLGNVTQVTEGNDTFTYVYVQAGYRAERLDSVTLKRTGQAIAEADYAYYQANDPDGNGNAGDLEQVRVFTTQDKGAPRQEVGGSYYRYYIPDFFNPLIAGDLEYAVTGQDYARLMSDTLGFVDSEDVSDYADYFDYDNLNRASRQIIPGAGTTSIYSLTQAEEFGYSYDNDGQSRGAGINAWSQKTGISLPTHTTQTVYTEFAGEPMLQARLTDLFVGLTWNTFFAYDPQARPRADSSAVRIERRTTR